MKKKFDLSHLTELEFEVTQNAKTEPPFSGIYNDLYEEGVYVCKVCGLELFSSEAKFNSSCGWPAFFEGIEGKISYQDDLSHGMVRTEILCKNCGSHLGHVFDDGFGTKTGKRYCVNSASLDFIES